MLKRVLFSLLILLSQGCVDGMEGVRLVMDPNFSSQFADLSSDVRHWRDTVEKNQKISRANWEDFSKIQNRITQLVDKWVSSSSEDDVAIGAYFERTLRRLWELPELYRVVKPSMRADKTLLSGKRELMKKIKRKVTTVLQDSLKSHVEEQPEEAL